MLGAIGMPEMLIILGICVLIFGPKQLPKIGKSLGEGIREFRGVGREIVKEHDDADGD